MTDRWSGRTAKPTGHGRRSTSAPAQCSVTLQGNGDILTPPRFSYRLLTYSPLAAGWAILVGKRQLDFLFTPALGEQHACATACLERVDVWRVSRNPADQDGAHSNGDSRNNLPDLISSSKPPSVLMSPTTVVAMRRAVPVTASPARSPTPALRDPRPKSSSAMQDRVTPARRAVATGPDGYPKPRRPATRRGVVNGRIQSSLRLRRDPFLAREPEGSPMRRPPDIGTAVAPDIDVASARVRRSSGELAPGRMSWWSAPLEISLWIPQSSCSILRTRSVLKRSRPGWIGGRRSAG